MAIDVLIGEKTTGGVQEGLQVARFKGLEKLDSGSLVGRFAIQKLTPDGQYVDINFMVGTYFSEYQKQNEVKHNIVSELYESLHLTTPILAKNKMTLPEFGEPIPDSLGAPVKVFLKLNKNGALDMGRYNYRTIFPVDGEIPAPNTKTESAGADII